MAFTLTNRGTGDGNYLASDSAGDTFTPNENDIIVFALTSNVSTSLTSVSGWGATFEEIVQTGTAKLHVWAARIGASPGSDQLSFISAKMNYSGVVFQIAGVKESGTLQSVFVQNQNVAVYDGTSPVAIPALAAYASATNLSMTFNAGASSIDFTAQSGWTRLVQFSGASNSLNTAVMYKASEDTSHTVEESGSSFAFRDITGAGFEIAEEAATGDTVAPNDLDQAQTIGNVTLTQNNALAVDDLSQSQSISNAELTQNNILSTDNLTQAQSIGQPSLTQNNIISVNNLTQSQSIDNVVLVIAGVLQVFGLTQAQSISIASLVQHNVLSVDGLTQPQTIDNVTLVDSSITITAQNLSQAQSISQPSLTQNNILAVNDLTQNQLIDAVFLGGIVVGYLKGEISVFSAYNGQIKVINALTGDVSVINPLKIQ